MDKFVTVKTISIILKALFFATTPIYLLALGKPFLGYSQTPFKALNFLIDFPHLFSENMIFFLSVICLLGFISISLNYKAIIKDRFTELFTDKH